MVAKQVVLVHGASRQCEHADAGPGGTVQYAAAAVNAARLGANLGQDTDPGLPFTESAGVRERVGGFSELILHPQ